MSSFAVEKIRSISSEMIIEAYEKHGKDMIVLDVSNFRETQYAQYLNLYFKLANDKIVSSNTWSLTSPDGLQVAGSISDPFSRKFAQLRFRVSHIDQEGQTNCNVKAMNYLCKAFEEKVQEMVDTKEITDNKKNCKVVNGKSSVVLLSTNIDTPMNELRYNKETKEYETTEYPSYWLAIPQKKFYNRGEVKLPENVMQFEDACYLDKDGAKDLSRPVKIHSFQPVFYDINKSSFNSKTGKRFYKKLGELDEETNTVVLNNTNIHKFLTCNSTFIGTMRIEVCVVRTQLKLNILLGNSIYVNVADQSEYINEEEIENAEKFAQKFSKPKVEMVSNVEEHQYEEETGDDDF